MSRKAFNWKKSTIYPIILIIVMFAVYRYRESNKAVTFLEIEGKTMGTTYHIKYLHENGIDFKASIDSLLVDFNQSLSTYIPDSDISKFNNNTSWKFKTPYFYAVLKKSEEVNEKSDGAFDPTVMPLVNAWGFGFKNRGDMDSSKVEKIMPLIGFSHIRFDESGVEKDTEQVMLDFSAIAKGYGVDVVSTFLESKEVNNYMVEIGGEVRCKGKNRKKEVWLIGIDSPKFSNEGRSLQATAKLQDLSLATSGNYRNYYEKDGVKYAHTINPKTGFPVNHTLLSASVFSQDCMTADAWATAFMVMGIEKSIAISVKENILVYLIYSDQETGKMRSYLSDGLKEIISEN